MLAWALILICFFFMPPPHPNPGLTPVNINYVWGPSDNVAQTWVHPYVWVLGLMIGMPLLLFLPVHLLLMRFAPKAPHERSPCRSAVATGVSPLRFALRELRGGLRGFYVFIACIALGVMAIAGVGSFARSLTDGLAREGRVILGGDLSFSLIHREATAAERAFLDRRGKVSAAATMRAMARTADGQLRAGRAQGGRRRLSALRRGDARSATCRWPRRWRSATARSARRSIRRCWRGSTCKPGARLTIGARHDRDRRGAQVRAGQARQRHRVRPARHRQRGGAARHRPAPARQPGALALPAARARTAATAPPTP